MSRRKPPHVDSLWDEAKSGRKLSAIDRRRVLVYLGEIGEDNKSTVELARIFQVDERTIYNDQQRILTDIAERLTPEAQMAVVARHMRDVERLIVRTNRALATFNGGEMGERFYVETMLKLLKEKRETLENVGVIRKELGNLNVSEENWVATIDTEANTLGVHQVK